MAKAFVASISTPPAVASDPKNMVLSLNVIYVGPEVAKVMASDVRIEITATETLSSFKTKIGQAVIANASSLGVTISSSDIIGPQYG